MQHVAAQYNTLQHSAACRDLLVTQVPSLFNPDALPKAGGERFIFSADLLSARPDIALRPPWLRMRPCSISGCFPPGRQGLPCRAARSVAYSAVPWRGLSRTAALGYSVIPYDCRTGACRHYSQALVRKRTGASGACRHYSQRGLSGRGLSGTGARAQAYWRERRASYSTPDTWQSAYVVRPYTVKRLSVRCL